MSARVSVATRATASTPAGVVTDSGQAFLVGRTQRGPIGVPVRVLGLADYVAVFGERSGGPDVFDAVSIGFKEGLGSAYVLRAGGPASAAASATLGAGMVVTAESPGAWANAKTVAWQNTPKILTVDGVDYTGTSVAVLNAALEVGGASVRVSGALAAADDSDVLAGGGDDFSNVDEEATLALLDEDLGDGAVVWPGGGEAVADLIDAHCAATNRLGVVCMTDPEASLAEVVVAAQSLSDLERSVLAWPFVEVETVAGTQVSEPLGFALGVRGRAHGASPAQSPIQEVFGRARYITGAVTDTTAAEWRVLEAAGVSVIRTSGSVLRMYGWQTLGAPDGVANLRPAQFRDLLNRVSVGCSQVAERFVGRRIDGKGVALGEFRGALTGFLSSLAGAFYEGPEDPGYVVDVGPGVNPAPELAAGKLHAAVGVRPIPSAGLVYIGVTATDAAGAL